ncbi:universal stress protein [Marinobacter nanhaiticus D15-8W]|uniref:Universal stress protein n=1 Tax=Marinobacter nanhaiticus D15-8W TaxID=626887 RepID=A0A371CG48_9GAMM|nr:universal stress protein [Marinobacter nanhaiticus]RDW95414.1 universal stress protein [Marinobacter nanhaiticus D15-8W]BES70069.1 universal stress protein [Marinobacter nanhaiticus D15-8W]
MDKGSSSIIVACDGSDQARSAAKLGGSLASALGQPLKLLTVFPESKASNLVLAGVGGDTMQAEKQKYARAAFDAAREVLGDGVEPEDEVILRGDPAHEILEYMQNNPGSHLILGRRGYSAIRSLTLGSVSEKIVRHATGPVTIVGA